MQSIGLVINLQPLNLLYKIDMQYKSSHLTNV